MFTHTMRLFTLFALYGFRLKIIYHLNSYYVNFKFLPMVIIRDVLYINHISSNVFSLTRNSRFTVKDLIEYR